MPDTARNIVFSSLSALLLTLLISTHSLAGDCSTAIKNDGVLTQAELRILAIHKADAVYRALDTNCDGKITNTELQAYTNKPVLSADQEQALSGQLKRFNNPPRQIELTANKDWHWASAQSHVIDKPLEPTVLVRRSHDQALTAITSTNGGGQGALLSFKRDYEASTDTIELHGSVMYIHPLATSENQNNIRQSILVSSISSDKTRTSTSPDNEVNDLTFRFGTETNYTDFPIEGSQLIRVGAFYQTDHSFKRAIYGADLEWEPQLDLGWVATSNAVPLPLFPSIKHQARTTLKAVYGYTADLGDGTQPDEASFLRAGPNIRWTLAPVNYPTFSFELQWRFLGGLIGSPDSIQAAEASVGWKPHAASPCGLKLNRRHGDTEISNTPFDDVSLQLEFKY